MKKINLRKELKEIGVIAIIFGILYFTGLHTTVAAYAQRAVLFTGIFTPDTEIAEDKKEELDFNLDLKGLNGEDIHLSELKGKVIFINIWATWCAPCIAEMPSIQKLYNKLENDNVAFVMLNMDRDQAKAQAFIEKKDYSFPAYYPNSQVPEVFKVPSIPTSFVVNKEGRIVTKEVGMANYNTKKFRGFLERLAEQEFN